MNLSLGFGDNDTHFTSIKHHQPFNLRIVLS